MKSKGWYILFQNYSPSKETFKNNYYKDTYLHLSGDFGSADLILEEFHEAVIDFIELFGFQIFKTPFFGEFWNSIPRKQAVFDLRCNISLDDTVPLS